MCLDQSSLNRRDIILRVYRTGPQTGRTGPAYLYGRGRDLNVVKPAQGAVPVDEVGGGELMQRLQGDQGAVGAGVSPFGSFAQLPLVHENGERLLSCISNSSRYSFLHLTSISQPCAHDRRRAHRHSGTKAWQTAKGHGVLPFSGSRTFLTCPGKYLGVWCCQCTLSMWNSWLLPNNFSRCHWLPRNTA